MNSGVPRRTVSKTRSFIVWSRQEDVGSRNFPSPASLQNLEGNFSFEFESVMTMESAVSAETSTTYDITQRRNPDGKGSQI
jgi:hypothetical protein